MIIFSTLGFLNGFSASAAKILWAPLIQIIPCPLFPPFCNFPSVLLTRSFPLLGFQEASSTRSSRAGGHKALAFRNCWTAILPGRPMKKYLGSAGKGHMFSPHLSPFSKEISPHLSPRRSTPGVPPRHCHPLTPRTQWRESVGQSGYCSF